MAINKFKSHKPGNISTRSGNRAVLKASSYTTTGLKISLQEKIKWLEEGVPPSRRTRQQLGLIIPAQEVNQNSLTQKLIAKRGQLMLTRKETINEKRKQIKEIIGGQGIKIQGRVQDDVVEDLQSQRKISARDVRERVKSYGKWYLEPRNFTMKNKISCKKVLKVDAGEQILPQDQEERMLFKNKKGAGRGGV